MYHQIIKKIQKTKKIAFLDIDLTLTGLPDIQEKTRELLEKKGYSLVYVTSRPYELVLSDYAIKKSSTLTRPFAKTEFHKNGKRFHTDLNTIGAFQGLLNPDIVASTTGLELFVKQSNDEYLKDELFNVFPFTSKAWKSDVKKLLKTAAQEKLRFTVKVTEDIKNYHNHEADIAPIDYRFQIDFPGLEDKKIFIKKLNDIKKAIPVFFLDDSEPEFNIYSIYLFPKKAENLKAEAIDYILEQITRQDDIQLKNIQTLIAGDSYPDLGMILYGAKDTHGLFYISGRSRLTKCFTDPFIKNYLDMNISSWKNNLHKKKPGIYTFNERTIYIADELFPGLWGAESLYQFLQSSYV
jgi:hypothetical protein